MWNRVYLLGAGASRELKFNISTLDYPQGVKTDKFLMNGPLSSGFFFDSNNLYQLINKRFPLAVNLTISDDLIEYVCEYYKTKHGKAVTKDDILNNEEISRRISIEKLYLYIEEAVREFEKEKTGKQGLNLDNPVIKMSMIKNDLLEYIYESLSLVCYYCFSIYHRVLALYILNYGGNVISFNWDILLDEAMNDTGKWGYKDGYGINFKDVVYKYSDKEDSLSQDKSSNFILKTHGSINWYTKTSTDDGLHLFVPLKRNLRGGALDTLRVYEYDNDRNQYFTSIVPPGIKRKAYPEIWKQIKEILENADEIIAIGFSFSDNDRYVKEELQGFSFKKNLKINLINPEADRLIDTYKEVFKTANVSKLFNTLGDFSSWIVKQEKMEELESVLN